MMDVFLTLIATSFLQVFVHLPMCIQPLGSLAAHTNSYCIIDFPDYHGKFASLCVYTKRSELTLSWVGAVQ